MGVITQRGHQAGDGRMVGVLIEHIRTIATKMAGLEGTDHGTGIYQFATPVLIT